MKKGFTLIEIIGIIILLGLIALLVYPTVVRIIGDSKDDLYNKNVSELERLAANWASINESKLPTIDKKGYYLKIEELKKDGFIDEDVTNPKTGEPMQGCVEILYDKSKDRHDYKYYDNCDHFVKPILSGFTSNVLENEYGWRNKDFYINLESEYLDYYEYCIGDSKCSPNIRVDNPNAGILINQEGIKYVCAKGNNTVSETTEECILYRLDKTKPVISGITFVGTMGLDNWYVSDVDVVTKKSTDNLSGIASDVLSPSETKITVDTKGTTYTLTARDLAGNVSSASYFVKVDKTAPTLGTLTINGTKGSNNWYTSDLTFSVTNGSDLTSGHKSTTSNITSITTETKGTNVVVTTKDVAGNTSTQTYVVKMDKTAPTAGTLTINGTKGDNGWYKSNVTFTLNNGSDSISGHSNTTTSHTSITTETSGTNVVVTTKNMAGLTSTRTYTIKIDKTAPTVGTLTINGTKGNNGWYKSNVTFTLNNGSDSLSGHASTTTTHTSITSDTGGTNVVVTTKDKAGNKSEKTYTIKVDKTAPKVEFDISGTLGETAVVNCSDTTSGVVNAQTTQTLSGTKDKTINGSCTDNAGNTATGSHVYKYTSCKTGSNTCKSGYVNTNCSSCYTGSPSECVGGYVQGSCKSWNTAKCGAASCTGACYSSGTNDIYYCPTTCKSYNQVYDSCATTKNTCEYGCDREKDDCATGSNTCKGGFNLN